MQSALTVTFNAFISCMITMIALYASGTIIFEKSTNKLIKNIAILIINTICMTIIFLNFNGTLKTVLMCLILTLTFKYIFSVSFSKSLITSIIYIIILMIPDLIILIFATKILNVSKELYYITFAGSILGNISVSLLMIIVIYILRKPLRKIINTEISASKKIVIMSIITILSTVYFFYKFAIGYRMNKDVIRYIVTMIAFATILFTLFKEKIQNELIVKKYDELLDVMKTYEIDIEEQSSKLHETKNEFMTIRSRIVDKVNDEDIIRYIDNVIEDKVSSDMSKYAKFAYLPSNGLKGFFYYKFMEAEKRNLNISVNISKTLEKSFLSELDTKCFKDLARIVGVYLDNAIQASELSKEKKLGVEVYFIKGKVHIIISNTFINKVDLNKIGNERYTTKGLNHGHGLLLVKKILYSNKMFTSDTRIENGLFVQELIITNKK